MRTAHPAKSATTKPNSNASAQAILDAIGGVHNIVSFTCCATRLRFELKDASRVQASVIEALPEVLGVVPQSGNRYQIIVGGAVQSVYTQVNKLIEKNAHTAGALDADAYQDGNAAADSDASVTGAATDVSAQAVADTVTTAAQTSDKPAFLDSFLEYLSDSFRPILGVLLGASLIIALTSLLGAFGLGASVDSAGAKAGGWAFIDAMWHAILYFLPIMVAYNASKKLDVDPWLGAAIMATLMMPSFTGLAANFDSTLVKDPALGTTVAVANIFGLPMQLNDYGGQVFAPLLMVPLLALVYHQIKKVFPANFQMVFVPFFSMLIMIPVTAFLIGPFSIWLGNTIGTTFGWINEKAPFAFAVLIPLMYPFLVPLGLHWPLNALMLVNINTMGYDFIQGSMGTWNFACFGATAGVLVCAMLEHDNVMRQTATGALAAGLIGGISEPSLYGIHLRYKRVYPRMLAGCLVGGITIGVLGLPTSGVFTSAFTFTSLLTIPSFTPMGAYAISVAAAFFTSMILVAVSGYHEKDAPDEKPAEAAADAVEAEPTSTAPFTVLSTVTGKVISLAETSEKVFASGMLGEGVGIIPEASVFVSPVTGTVNVVQKNGHAYGITSADGVEVLVHIGIDTVELEGRGFTPQVAVGQQVQAGDPLAQVDLDVVREAGFETTTFVVITNTDDFAQVKPLVGMTADVNTPVIEITK